MKLTISEIQDIETEIVKEISMICTRNNIDYYLHCGSALGAIRHNGPIPWDPDVDIIIPHNQIDNFCIIMRNELPNKFYLDYYDENKIYPASFPRIGLRGYSTNILHVDIFKLVGISSDEKEQLKYAKKARLLNIVFLFKVRSEKYFGKFTLKKRISNLILKLILIPIRRDRIIRIFENHCNKYSFNESDYVTNPSGHYGFKNVLKKEIYGHGTVVKYSGFDVIIPKQYDEYLRHYYGDYMQYPPEKERDVKQTYHIEEI
jgi:lipopolysaccharide cholinephosphotransferase